MKEEDITVHMHICVIGSPSLFTFPLPRISVHNSEKKELEVQSNTLALLCTVLHG